MTLLRCCAHHAGMDSRDLAAELQRLLGRIDQLAALLQRTQDENRSRVEAMISRLKSLEQHT